MPTHYVVRSTSTEDRVNELIKENEAKGAGLIQVLPILIDNATAEVMLVFRSTDDPAPRAAGFKFAANLDADA